jgi:hypothetical protein
MSAEPTPRAAATEQEMFTIGDLLAFVQIKREALAKQVSSREQMHAMWSTGTSAGWRKAKCKMTKAQRVKEADMHKAIAAAQRREVAMYDAVIHVLNKDQQ